MPSVSTQELSKAGPTENITHDTSRRSFCRNLKGHGNSLTFLPFTQANMFSFTLVGMIVLVLQASETISISSIGRSVQVFVTMSPPYLFP